MSLSLCHRWRNIIYLFIYLYIASDTQHTISGYSDTHYCRLVTEFGIICEIRMLRVNVCESKVMRCSLFVNGGGMHVILNGEPLEEVDCFKYLGYLASALLYSTSFNFHQISWLGASYVSVLWRACTWVYKQANFSQMGQYHLSS